MKFMKSFFVLITTSVMATTAFANPDGVLRSLGSAATARDILYTYCPASPLPDRYDRAVAFVKDRYPLKAPLLRVRIKVDNTPSTPCPGAPTTGSVAYDYSDSIFEDESLGILGMQSGFNSPWTKFSGYKASTNFSDGVGAIAKNAAPGIKYCIYVDKLAGYVIGSWDHSFAGVNAGPGSTPEATANGAENYELMYYCLGANETVPGSNSLVPAKYQQNQ